MARIHAFKVVIAYEDLAGAIRAREMSERWTAQLQQDIEISCEVWKFDFLRHADFWEQAVNDAEAADLIVISAHGDAQLPVHVRTWIESWLPQKRNSPAAFVALLDQEEDGPSEPPSPSAYLRQIADRAGMDFFLKTGGRWQPGFRPAGQTVPYQPDKTSPMLQEVVHEPHAAWQDRGIND